MNLSKDKVTEIFYFADNFCKEFHKSIEAHAIEESGKDVGQNVFKYQCYPRWV